MEGRGAMRAELTFDGMSGDCDCAFMFVLMTWRSCVRDLPGVVRLPECKSTN